MRKSKPIGARGASKLPIKTTAYIVPQSIVIPTATKKAAVWYGIWIIRVVNKERTYEKLLVPARKKLGDDDEIAVRTFKTANGLISFLESMGFPQINIDLIAGMLDETEDNWKACVAKTIEMSPDSVTVYQMEVPYNTTIYKRGTTYS